MSALSTGRDSMFIPLLIQTKARSSHLAGRLLRLLKLHLLCGSLPDLTSGDRIRPPLEPERGFVGVIAPQLSYSSSFGASRS